jgi:DNA-directed RNA polymerase subunit K/omega
MSTRYSPVRATGGFSEIHRPAGLCRFEFAVLAGLRAGQLARGCTPRVSCANKVAVTAQLEVAAGTVVRQITGEAHALVRPTD